MTFVHIILFLVQRSIKHLVLFVFLSMFLIFRDTHSTGFFHAFLCSQESLLEPGRTVEEGDGSRCIFLGYDIENECACYT